MGGDTGYAAAIHDTVRLGRSQAVIAVVRA
jgi:hypothetical protein